MTDEPDPIEPEEPGPQDQGGEDERRYPSTIGGALYIVILAACGAGVAVVASGDWRLGVRILAVALMVAAGIRLVLPARDAGMLAVRHRAIDVTVLALMGALIYFLASSIPNQPS